MDDSANTPRDSPGSSGYAASPSSESVDIPVTVRYWAGARAAAGQESEQLAATTIGQLRQVAVTAHPALAAVLPRCSFLLDGQRSDDDVALTPGGVVEVLPPFAGG